MANRDRYGERREPKPTPACGDPDCKGWRGVTDKEHLPIPCYPCRPELRKTIHDNDFAEREPSARARAAISAANERENQK